MLFRSTDKSREEICARTSLEYPLSFQNSFLVVPVPENILRKMKLSLKFRARNIDEGLLLYGVQNSDGSGDFFSLGINDKFLEFQFDSGSGSAVLQSKGKVKTNTWHRFTIERHLRNGTLTLDDDPPVSGQSPGNTRGLNVKHMFVGGSNDSLSNRAGISESFDGCITEIQKIGRAHV